MVDSLPWTYFLEECADTLSRLEAEMANTPYIRDRHPGLLAAVAHARSAASLASPNAAMLLSSITAAAAAYTSPVAPASDLFVNFESVLVVAIRALAMVAQSADVSGRLTLLALSCTAQLLRSAERIEISTSSSDGVFALAVTAAGTARFRITSGA
jgi:hypothetical protein